MKVRIKKQAVNDFTPARIEELRNQVDSEIRELVAAAEQANRWLGKLVADNTFEGTCVAPHAAKTDMIRLQKAIERIMK